MNNSGRSNGIEWNNCTKMWVYWNESLMVMAKRKENIEIMLDRLDEQQARKREDRTSAVLVAVFVALLLLIGAATHWWYS